MIEALRTIITWIDTQVEAYMETERSGAATETLRVLIAAYDALAPRWSDAPSWANWYTVNTDGRSRFWEYEPYYDAFGGEWMGRRGSVFPFVVPEGLQIAPPVGVDPRLCIWEKPPLAGKAA